MIMRKTTKNILWGLSFFLVLIASVLIVNYVRKPADKISVKLPSPVATSKGEQTPPIMELAPAVCSLSFSVSAPLVPGLNCKAKELYKDASGNTAGTYDTSSANKLSASYELVPGEIYLYVISYENTGTGATDGTVTDTLPTGTSFVDASTGCSNASGKVTCTLGNVAAAQSGQKVIRFKVSTSIAASSITNTATLTPGEGDTSTCKVTNPIKPSPTPSISPSPSPSPSEVASPNPSPSPTPSPSPSTVASPNPSPSNPANAALDCVVKRAYENDSRNTSGTYYLNNEIVDTSTLSNGQTIVYNVVVANNGETAASDVMITDVLSNNLTFVDASSGCTYSSSNRTVTCNIGSVSGGTQASKSFRTTIGVSGTTSIANTAKVSSTNGQQDSCSINVNATGQVVLQPSPVPSALPNAGVFEITAGTLSVGAILLILGTLGLLLL